MDARIFGGAPMGLRKLILSVPWSKRVSYNPTSHVLFITFEGSKLRTPQDIKDVITVVEQKLQEIQALKNPSKSS